MCLKNRFINILYNYLWQLKFYTSKLNVKIFSNFIKNKVQFACKIKTSFYKFFYDPI